MSQLRKITVLVLVILCNFSYLFAMDTVTKKPQSTVAFAGKVIDKVTDKPIVNAKIKLYISGVSKSAFTGSNGEYRAAIAGSSLSRLARLTVTAKEYKKAVYLLFIPSGSSTQNKDFKLRDVAAPRIEISHPCQNQEIIDTDEIRLTYYNDCGSGIDETSLKIFANEREITQYAHSFSDLGVTTVYCPVSETQPLDKGECVISAQISDFSKNTSRRSVSVVIVSKADYFIKLGKNALAENDILSANGNFMLALSAAKDNPEANFYYAFTRVAALSFKYSIYSLLKDMGWTGPNGSLLEQYYLDPSHFNAKPPAGIENFNLAVSFPNPKQIQDMIYSEIIPEIDKALENLDLVLAKKDFVSYLSAPNPITQTENIRIDYADAALLKSVICAVKANLYELLVRNLDCDLSHLSLLFRSGALTPEYVLTQYPELLRVQEIPHSLRAKEALVLAIDSYIDAFNFMQTQTGDQSNDLISISPQYMEDAKLFTEQVQDIKKSLLSQPDLVFSMKFSQCINLGNFFTNPFDFREILGTKTISYLLQDNFLPLMDYALNNLAKADVDYQEYLPPQSSFSEGKNKEADFADIVAAKSALESIRMSFLSLLGYNCDVDVQAVISDAFKNRHISFNDILDHYANLLKLSNQDNIISAKQTLSNIVKRYNETIDYLSNREDIDQSDDILILSEDFRANESKYKAVLEGLNNMQSTLIDPVIGITTKEIYVNPAGFFLSPKDIRQFLPKFDSDNEAVANSFPDITFGGTVSGYELPD